MRPLLFLSFLFCIFQASASVAADLCAEYPRAYPNSLRCAGGNCPKQLQTAPTQFQSLTFVAACDYQIGKQENIPMVNGIFIFQGEQIVSGVLRRELIDFVNEFTLRGEKKTSWPTKPPVFFRNEIYLQFPDAFKAEKLFNAPKVNSKTHCWEAKVQFKITEMHSIFGWDNIEGDYPKKYSVLAISPYRKCLNPTPDPSDL